jgi:hypothetical protein
MRQTLRTNPEYCKVYIRVLTALMILAFPRQENPD